MSCGALNRDTLATKLQLLSGHVKSGRVDEKDCLAIANFLTIMDPPASTIEEDMPCSQSTESTQSSSQSTYSHLTQSPSQLLPMDEDTKLMCKYLVLGWYVSLYFDIAHEP